MAAVNSSPPLAQRRLLALSVIDSLAQALQVRGPYPAPFGAMRCEAVATVAPVATAYDPPLVLCANANASGYLLFDGTYTRPGTATRQVLGPATYQVRVRSDYYQDASFNLIWPQRPDQTRVVDAANQPINLSLLPGANYPLPDTTLSELQLGPTVLRGAARAANGDPLPGIVAELANFAFVQPLPNDIPPLALADWQPFLQPTTDANGAWAIVLPGRRYYDATAEVPPTNAPMPLQHALTVRVHYPQGNIDRAENVPMGTDYAVRNTALRGLALSARQIPIGGVRIATSASAAATVTRADGAWSLYFPLDQVAVPNVAVTATLPTGAVLASNVALVPKATVAVPTFIFP